MKRTPKYVNCYISEALIDVGKNTAIFHLRQVVLKRPKIMQGRLQILGV
jgi:hypothetical protein